VYCILHAAKSSSSKAPCPPARLSALRDIWQRLTEQLSDAQTLNIFNAFIDHIALKDQDLAALLRAQYYLPVTADEQGSCCRLMHNVCKTKSKWCLRCRKKYDHSDIIINYLLTKNLNCPPAAFTHAFNFIGFLTASSTASHPDHLQRLLEFSDVFQFWSKIVNTINAVKNSKK